MKNAMHKLEELLEIGGIKKDVVLLVIGGIALILSIAGVDPFPFNIAWIAIVLCGLPIILEAVIGMVTAFDIKADVLVSIALVASVCIGEYFAAAEVAVIMQIGSLLEEITVARARAGIEKLVNLRPETARVIKNGVETTIPAEKVKIGDIVKVLPGETVAVDGIILSGQTSINQAVMTGESIPVDKGVGDEVQSGTINQFGAFEMRATKVGEDSSIQRMIKLVQSADAGKAKIVGIADRWATWIVIIALSAAAITWLVSGEIIRAVTILVVFCPCALVLATPTAIMAAIGNVTKHGFLVRDGAALERLASVTKITFDKTGTLTYGDLTVKAVKSVSDECTEDKIFELCASAESMSEHPIAKAVLASYKEKFADKNPAKCDDFKMLPGRGVSCTTEGYEVVCGNKKMIDNAEIEFGELGTEQEFVNEACTIIYVAISGKLVGFVALSDTVRKESKSMLEELAGLGVKPVLLTGDNENSASAIASQLKIKEVRSNCLPEDKLRQIDIYQKNGEKVCMIGDGVNDAPALKKAEVGIAMGGIGSDIAVEAADIVLVDDEVKELPHLVALAKRMFTIIKINMSFSMGLNFLAIILAITGILNPVAGALVHNAGSVLVIINSALLLGWKRRKKL